MSKKIASGKSSKDGKSFFKKSEESQSKKRKSDDDGNASFELDSGNQISLLLQEFGGSMQKKLESKQKKMKQEIEESVEISSSEMLGIFNNQAEERQGLLDNFRTKLTEFIDQEISNMQKEQEIKNQLQKAMKTREKEIIQLINKKNEHLSAMKAISDIFFQGIEDLSQTQKQQYSEMYNEMQETMKKVHKKIQANKQEEAMVKLRKNLQSILE